MSKNKVIDPEIRLLAAWDFYTRQIEGEKVNRIRRFMSFGTLRRIDWQIHFRGS